MMACLVKLAIDYHTSSCIFAHPTQQVHVMAGLQVASMSSVQAKSAAHECASAVR